MQLFRYTNGAWPNGLALAYVAGAYCLSIALLATGSGVFWLAGCLLLAHALIIAAYLLHECIHQTIFRQRRHNLLLGQALAWLTGAACTPYAILEKKHLRHHADRVDVLAIDYREFLQRQPRLQRLMSILQRVHLPAIELLVDMLSCAAPFLLHSRRHLRGQVLLVIGSRLLFFILLAIIDLAILPGYLFAWLLMLTVLGFMDAWQHDYPVRLRLEDEQFRQEFDRDFEEAHTYSNLLSTRWPVLNLLVLNFCYHNAHHYKSGLPWYALPTAHAERYAGRDAPVIPLAQQCRDYHRYRLERLLPTCPDMDAIGAGGVSFLAGV